MTLIRAERRVRASLPRVAAHLVDAPSTIGMDRLSELATSVTRVIFSNGTPARTHGRCVIHDCSISAALHLGRHGRRAALFLLQLHSAAQELVVHIVAVGGDAVALKVGPHIVGCRPSGRRTSMRTGCMCSRSRCRGTGRNCRCESRSSGNPCQRTRRQCPPPTSCRLLCSGNTGSSLRCVWDASSCAGSWDE